MQVILREDVNHLGEVGDLVTVKPGYARNYLLPRGLAVQANARQLSRVEHEKRLIESRIAKARSGAEAEKSKLDEVVLTVEKSAGENGKLFGSVTAMELEAMLRDNGFTIDRRRLQLEENIKSLGEYDIGVKLHRDVVATIKVLVVARPDSE
jgi:large subunit ribosomal protein L9